MFESLNISFIMFFNVFYAKNSEIQVFKGQPFLNWPYINLNWEISQESSFKVLRLVYKIFCKLLHKVRFTVNILKFKVSWSLQIGKSWPNINSNWPKIVLMSFEYLYQKLYLKKDQTKNVLNLKSYTCLRQIKCIKQIEQTNQNSDF